MDLTLTTILFMANKIYAWAYHKPEERLNVRPSGVVGVGGENQFNTDPTMGTYLSSPCETK